MIILAFMLERGAVIPHQGSRHSPQQACERCPVSEIFRRSMPQRSATIQLTLALRGGSAYPLGNQAVDEFGVPQERPPKEQQETPEMQRRKEQARYISRLTCRSRPPHLHAR